MILGLVGGPERNVVNSAGAEPGAHHLRLDRDVKLGVRATLVHLVDMDSMGVFAFLEILARAWRSPIKPVSIASVGPSSGTLIIMGPRPRI